MTDPTLTPLVRSHPARARPLRAGPLRRAVGLAAVAGLVTLGLAAAPPPQSTGQPARVALVADAGARPERALADARAWVARTERRGGVDVAVRIPRTAAEAVADVRYFAAQGYDRVVVAGPRARAAAARAAADGRFRSTRFERAAARAS
jgi:hypothetical protein